MISFPHPVDSVAVACNILLDPTLRSSCVCVPVGIGLDLSKLLNRLTFVMTFGLCFVYIWLETTLFELFLFFLGQFGLVFQESRLFFPKLEQTLMNWHAFILRRCLLADDLWLERALLDFLNLLYFPLYL